MKSFPATETASISPKAPKLASSVYDVFRHGHVEGTTPINLTIGNPHLKPPASYYQALDEVVRDLKDSPTNGHGYTTKDDPYGLCQALASDLSARFGGDFQKSDILLTVGATGALDIIFKTLIRPAIDPVHPTRAAKPLDEVIVIAPYFVEYLNLIHGNGGLPVVVPSDAEFGMDPEAIGRAITARTRAILVNSPNNPTGRIYPTEALYRLSEVLEEKSREIGHRIVVVEDSVYDAVVFTPRPAPSMIPHYPTLIRVNSYSKSLSLAGERLGYLAVHPGFAPTEERKELVGALNLNMRIRVVQAPLMQHRIVAKMPLHGHVDIEAYHRNVERLHLTLSSLGYRVHRPEGTFYLWAVLPESFENELEFRELAFDSTSPLLYLPGTLFGGDAYDRCVRFSACGPFAEIERACHRLLEISDIRNSSIGPLE